MKSNYKRLGNYILRCDEFNEGMLVEELLGISNNKYFQKAKTNVIGINLEKYRIVRTGQFAFNRATTRNGNKISIALREGHDCIVSPSYRVFKSKDENVLNSEYLMMWFRRPEFDRYARFKSHGSAHEFFDWEEMCEVGLPIPSIDKQREIVKEYNTIINRIRLNEQLSQKLEETAQAIYKRWFVEFEFPISAEQAAAMGKPELEGKPYKTNGGAMVWCEELEQEVPEGWEIVTLDQVCNCLDNERIPLSGEQRKRMQGRFPYFGAMSIVDHINDYIYDGTYLLMSEDGANVVDENGRPALQYVWGKFWLNNHAHILQGKDCVTTEILMLILSNTNVSDLITGAAQPKINQKNMMSIELLKPVDDQLKHFNLLIKPLFEEYKAIRDMNFHMKILGELILSRMTKVEVEREVV